MDSRVESGRRPKRVPRQTGLNFIAPCAFEEKVIGCPTNLILRAWAGMTTN